MNVTLAYKRELEQNRLRKERYRKPCPKCGRLMTGCNGPTKPPSQCHVCAAEEQHAEAYWSDARVIEAAQDWQRIFGRPPRATDWRRTQAVRGHRFPPTSACYAAGRNYRLRPWRTWHGFLLAAGFNDAPSRGKYPRTGVAQLRAAGYQGLRLAARAGGVTANELASVRSVSLHSGYKTLKGLARRGLIYQDGKRGKAHIYRATDKVAA